MIIGDSSKRCWLYSILLIAVSSTLIYWRMLDNFFYSDDFEWLDQVRNLEQKPLSIFNPVVHPPSAQLALLPPNYFTPLIHIIFWFNYRLFGLNPFGYHLFDLSLHIVNSCLVFYLISSLAGNLALAALAGLFFASSFAITDAVIWSGARVDTVMFTFYILSMTTFLSFLKKGGHGRYILSILLFILSLTAKGTALVLPLALFLIERHLRPKTRINHLLKYLPYASIVLVYIALLRYDSTGDLILTQVGMNRVVLNILKVPMTLFIPEGLLPVNPWPALLTAVVFFAFAAFVLKKETSGIGYLGIMLMLMGVLPLIPVSWDFPSNPDPFNTSIRHRLYLGNLGSAMFIGGVVYHFYRTAHKVKYKAVLWTLLLALIAWNLFWNQRIQGRWDEVTDNTRSVLNELKGLILRQHLEDKFYYFINCPPNQGLGDTFIMLYFEPYGLRFDMFSSEIPPGIDPSKIDFIICIDGHVFNSPVAAAKAASTPMEHYFVAHHFLLTGNMQDSVGELEKASPSNRDERLQYRIAMTYLKKLGLTYKAVEELKKVIVLNENSVEAYKLLGVIFIEIKDDDSAIGYFEKALRLDKRDSRIMRKLAELYEEKGEVEKAKELWETARRYENS